MLNKHISARFFHSNEQVLDILTDGAFTNNIIMITPPSDDDNEDAKGDLNFICFMISCKE